MPEDSFIHSVHCVVCDHGHFLSDRPNQREPDRRVICMQWIFASSLIRDFLSFF